MVLGFAVLGLLSLILGFTCEGLLEGVVFGVVLVLLFRLGVSFGLDVCGWCLVLRFLIFLG